MSYGYKSIDQLTPQEQILETCIIEDGKIRMEQCLIKKGNLWWFTDMSMYVYYTPTHYRTI
jgi:hypothetical protein